MDSVYPVLKAIRPAEVGAIGDQPEKTILRLFDVIHYRAGHALVSGEMSTQKAARWLVWINCADRDTRDENPKGGEYQPSNLLYDVCGPPSWPSVTLVCPL